VRACPVVSCAVLLGKTEFPPKADQPLADNSLHSDIMSTSKKALYVVFLTIFVDVMGFGILIPIIPILLADPTSPYFILKPGTSLGYGYIMLGFLTAIFPLMQFIAAPILGQLSDRYGRRKILAISLSGTCFSYALFAFGIVIQNIPILFISRALDGITGGVISTAQAVVADTSDHQNRVKSFGFLGAAFGLGFILGPLLGGKLSDNTLVSWFNATTPFWFAAALSFINVMSVIFFLPETFSNNQIHKKIIWKQSLYNLGRAYAHKNLRTLFLSIFLFSAGFTFFTAFVSVFLINRFHYTQSNIGDFFGWIGVCSILSQVFIVGRLAKKISESVILRFSFLGAGLTMMLIFLATERWLLFSISALQVIFVSLTNNNSTSLISKSAGPNIQGEILGINVSVQALAQFIPPVLSGFIATLLTPGAPVLVASIFIIIAGLVFIFYYRPKKQEGACLIDPTRCEGQWL
jgi:DHA1 family tetracycline resistance protein-like MFS transporter